MLAISQDRLGGPEVLKSVELERLRPVSGRSWCGFTRPP